MPGSDPSHLDGLNVASPLASGTGVPPTRDGPFRELASRDAGIRDGRSEEDLVLAIRAGEAGAWAELARRVLPRVYGLCFRLLGKRDEASDAAQAVMLRLVQVLGQYDARSRFSTWTYRIATNVCISRMRSAKVRQTLSLSAPEGSDGDARYSPVGREPDPRVGVERQDAARRLGLALASLEPDQRAILILRDGQDLSYEHIAGVLDVGLGTVKSRLFRARAALRQAMEDLAPGSVDRAGGHSSEGRGSEGD